MDRRLKVSFRFEGRTYAPGDILPDGISASDLAYLRKKGFVEPVDAVFLGVDGFGQEADGFQCVDGSGQEAEDFPRVDTEDDGMGVSFPELNEGAQGDLKSPGEVQKMRTKDEVYIYAQSIGFDLGESYKERALKELQENVIAYQEQAGMEASP